MNDKNLSLPDKLIRNTIKEDLIKKYNDNTLIRGLIQAVPYGAVVDNILTVSYNNILIDRANEFYDELGKGNIELTREIVESEDFLHAYFNSYKAALHTKQREKIRFLARLLQNGITSGLISMADEYDDYLKILDELTFREITILHILDNYQSKCERKENENDLQRANAFWNDFEKESTEVLMVTSSELKAFLSRIERTGCYKTIIGTFFGYTGDRGYLTETFYKLKGLIEIKDVDFIYYKKE